MNPRSGTNAAFALAALAVATFVKWECAHAGADELGFLLAPTSALVTGLTGLAFVHEHGSGYLSREAHVIVAPVCSGMNFMVIAFVSLVVGFVGRLASTSKKLAWFAAAGLVAYAATVLTNAARISLALVLGREPAPFAALGGSALHRLEGVGVYLASLLLLYAAVDRALGRRGGAALAVPLAAYLGATLIVPALRGGFAHPEYRAHAQSVGVAVAAVAALAALVGRGSVSGRRC